MKRIPISKVTLPRTSRAEPMKPKRQLLHAEFPLSLSTSTLEPKCSTRSVVRLQQVTADDSLTPGNRISPGTEAEPVVRGIWWPCYARYSPGRALLTLTHTHVLKLITHEYVGYFRTTLSYNVTMGVDPLLGNQMTWFPSTVVTGCFKSFQYGNDCIGIICR